ncbi:hypothetical protein D9Q98_002375 [Chlorella vulgaris]|uniref:Uncharacterized protein n=1 Tax=Chlorella vulgaris TaxID=3077 RepID=A0A9D4Z175_CHLVU|nr:hypothetical protein D9Q98_002375 [Chlorella vulgaris]
MIAYLLLSLLLSTTLQSAQGRQMPFRPETHRLLTEQATEEAFALPASAVAGSPSPLLNAPHVDGWVTVAAPRSNSTYADDEALETRIIDGTVDSGNAAFPYAAYLEWTWAAARLLRAPAPSLPLIGWSPRRTA